MIGGLAAASGVNLDVLASRVGFVNEAEAGAAGQGSLNQDVFGKELTDLRGRPDEAIEHLLREKRGYVPGAFYREELGRIDLP